MGWSVLCGWVRRQMALPVLLLPPLLSPVLLVLPPVLLPLSCCHCCCYRSCSRGVGRFVTDRRGWVVLTWYHADAEGVSVVVVRGRIYLGCLLIPPFCSFPSPRLLLLPRLVGRALVMSWHCSGDDGGNVVAVTVEVVE
jgi:hypothetical protein